MTRCSLEEKMGKMNKLITMKNDNIHPQEKYKNFHLHEKQRPKRAPAQGTVDPAARNRFGPGFTYDPSGFQIILVDSQMILVDSTEQIVEEITRQYSLKH